MSANISLMGAVYSDVPAVLLPKQGGGQALFTDVSDTTASQSDVASGKYFYDSTGTKRQGTSSGGGGTTMNKQIYVGPAQVKNNGYIASNATLTVAVSGTYTISWTAWRSSSRGTMGTNLHKNNTSGTNQQTFTGTYGQTIKLTNQSLSAGDVLTIYATSGSSSYSIYIGQLTIEQTS